MRWVLALFLLALAGVYSVSYVPAPSVITSSTQCYYISNIQNAVYRCKVALDTPCFYDIIIKNSKNINLYCNFNRILIYNSSNIKIYGSGSIISWKSTYIICKGEYTNTSPQTYYIVCTPQGIYAWINAQKVPLGALGYIKIEIYSTHSYSNLMLRLQSTCQSYLSAVNSSIPAYLLGSTVLIKNINAGDMGVIYYRYIPEIGKNCRFYLSIKQISTEQFVNITNTTIATTGSVKVSSKNYIVTPEILNTNVVVFLLFLFIMAIK